jgi:hypothetical protein
VPKISKSKSKVPILTILLDNSNKSFYWIGFLLADGCFHENRKITLEISIKDLKHLLKFKKYIKLTNKTSFIHKNIKNNCSLSFTDTILIPKITNYFDINIAKTYHPPNIVHYDKFTDEQLFSLIIGFIDGDGNIRKVKTVNNTFHYHITLENHQNWKQFYKFIELFLYDYLNIEMKKQTYIRTNNRNYICLSFTRKEFIFNINKKRKFLKLPVLQRKWNILNHITSLKSNRKVNKIIKSFN